MSDLLKDMVELDGYTLRLRETKDGKRCYVVRSRWMSWFGKPVIQYGADRRVSGWLPDKEAARQFCIAYTEKHPGCWTTTQAIRVCEGLTP